tara:strand:- start:213 stop:791 length:579 start_codon:yes stop_codon:yes gene_type:complete
MKSTTDIEPQLVEPEEAESEVVTQVVVTKAVPPPAAMVQASPETLRETLRQYREIQQVLDEAMPESLVTIGRKKHRTKSYWRAIATTFNLNVVCVEEQHVQAAGKSTDWGWLTTYRATAPNGRVADGDGSCFVSEKAGRGQGSVHNVRSHAHTRAYNRAVSNLVGFGEVSAEEMVRGAPVTSTRKVEASKIW